MVLLTYGEHQHFVWHCMKHLTLQRYPARMDSRELLVRQFEWPVNAELAVPVLTQGPRIAPRRQVRGVHAFPRGQPFNLAVSGAAVGFFEDPKSVLGSKLAPVRPCDSLRIRGPVSLSGLGPGSESSAPVSGHLPALHEVKE